mmetsp:Transcript_14532/g.16062  ORF Transcript_14532/g.16062 Transcript_14532/m.16062 type:complete len:137 (-) Transcript_14532:169-579(-)|eukprot:CAMPEP_0115005146 /NCGR_PEP_ID=MMETSP0216-20121206/19681_1 /TAXON_ID=223996 /ORGANISM="Protocruzia adherens, Strain Boccale" /LENGTH=136 /DNA_ID=CAMNT_0002371383 /DNA_START=202 /DNA_END=612 /DNA_ORIENTATION=+
MKSEERNNIARWVVWAFLSIYCIANWNQTPQCGLEYNWAYVTFLAKMFFIYLLILDNKAIMTVAAILACLTLIPEGYYFFKMWNLAFSECPVDIISVWIMIIFFAADYVMSAYFLCMFISSKRSQTKEGHEKMIEV